MWAWKQIAVSFDELWMKLLAMALSSTKISIYSQAIGSCTLQTHKNNILHIGFCILSNRKHTLEWWNERELNAVYGLNTKTSASGAIEFDIYANELLKKNNRILSFDEFSLEKHLRENMRNLHIGKHHNVKYTLNRSGMDSIYGCLIFLGINEECSSSGIRCTSRTAQTIQCSIYSA